MTNSTLTGCNGHDSTYHNFDLSGSYNTITGIRSYGTTNNPDSAAYGILINTTYSTYSNIYSYQDYRGVSVNNSDNSIFGCNVYNSTQLGFWSQAGISRLVVNGLWVRSCGNTNIRFTNTQNSTISNVLSTGSGGYGIDFATVVTYCTITGLVALANTTYDIYFAGASYCQISGVHCNGTATGLYVATGSYSGFEGINSYNHAGVGIQFAAGSNCVLSGSTVVTGCGTGITLAGGATNYEHGTKSSGNTTNRNAGNDWTTADIV